MGLHSVLMKAHPFFVASILNSKDGTYLLSALNDIEGANEGVGDTAGEDTSNHAFLIVSHIMDFSAGHF